MTDLLRTRVRVVLVAPTHPGNIGAAARAMKTMGLARLSLVAPLRFPSAEATAMAAGADDILHGAVVCDSLGDAVSGCGFIVATSARPRSLGWPELSPRSCAQRVLAEAGRGEVAVVFGREHAGLTNAELDRCQALVRIPTDPDFRSLNLAAAVQVIAYELRVAASGDAAPPPARGAAAPTRPADADDMERLFQHLEATLVTIGYLDPAQPKRLMRRLRRLLARAHPDRTEVDILRGVLAAAQRAARS